MILGEFLTQKHIDRRGVPSIHTFPSRARRRRRDDERPGCVHGQARAASRARQGRRLRLRGRRPSRVERSRRRPRRPRRRRPHARRPPIVAARPPSRRGWFRGSRRRRSLTVHVQGHVPRRREASPRAQGGRGGGKPRPRAAPARGPGRHRRHLRRVRASPPRRATSVRRRSRAAHPRRRVATRRTRHHATPRPCHRPLRVRRQVSGSVLRRLDLPILGTTSRATRRKRPGRRPVRRGGFQPATSRRDTHGFRDTSQRSRGGEPRRAAPPRGWVRARDARRRRRRRPG